MTALSTHVLDTVRGEPASGVVVRLERAGPAGGAPGTGHDGGWPEPDGAASAGGCAELARAVTDADGRVSDFGVAGPLPAGTYRLVFGTGPYLAARHPGEPGGQPFFPEVVVTFNADGRRPRYHVPLLLSPFSYSTYRGS